MFWMFAGNSVLPAALHGQSFLSVNKQTNQKGTSGDAGVNAQSWLVVVFFFFHRFSRVKLHKRCL